MDTRINPGVRINIYRMFDKWYAESRTHKPNRTNLIQRAMLAPMDDPEKALQHSKDRDDILKIDRTKKGT